MKPMFKSRVADFGRDRCGGLATTFAMALLPLALSVTAAVDYSHFISRRTKLQAAADNAVLAALGTSPSGPTDAQTSQYLSAVIGPLADVTVSSQNFVFTPATSTSPAKYKATISGSIAAPTSSLLPNLGTFTITATAALQSQNMPTSAQIVATTARCAYWKSLQFFVHNVGATSDSVIATYTYQPTNLSGSGPSGSITFTFPDGTTALWDSNGNFISGSIEAVSLGSAYDNAYLVQTVSPSGCPAGQTPDPTQPLTNITCIAAGSTVQSSNGSLQTSPRYNLMETFSSPTCVSPGCSSYAYTVNPIGSPWTSATNDPGTSNSLFVSQSAIPQPPTSAVQIPLGSTPTITTLIPCGQVTYWALEDTPWKSGGLTDGDWQSQDFFFTIQGVQCGANSDLRGGPILTQ